MTTRVRLLGGRPLAGGLILAAVVAIGMCDVASAATVEVWFNAFIPSVATTAGTAFVSKKDRTLIADPLNADTCYSTDDRTFSDADNASSRVAVRLTLEVGQRQFSIKQQRVVIGPSHKIRCSDLAELPDSPKSSSGDCVVVSSVKESARFVRTIGITASAPNPFFQIFGEPCSLVNVNYAGRIDFAAVIAYDILSGEIEIRGATGTFPAFEGYYRIDGGPTSKIFTRTPSVDTSPTALFDFGLGINTENFGPVTFRPTRPNVNPSAPSNLRTR